MRPRLLVILVLLAALPVGVGLLLGREGRPKPQHGAAQIPTQISLDLKRPTGDTRLVGCGITHHYAVYPTGVAIAFRGSVAVPPPGHWRVRVKLKSCVAGAFRPSGDSPVEQRRDGRFKGSFSAPVPGLYTARASVNVGGRQLARSYKRYFLIR